MLALVATTGLLASCKGLIYEYEGNCDDTVEIYLKYDYNTARADMRADHVGYAVVYAVDHNGNVAASQTVSGREVHDKNLNVVFSGLQPGRYTFTALAMQRPYEDCVKGQGARWRVEFPSVSSAVSGLNARLDRSAAADAEGLHHVDAPKVGLDTLWIGQSIKAGGVEVLPVEQQRGNVLRDTVSLVRDTKYLHLTLHQVENRADIYDTDFSVRIVDANGHLAWDNGLIADETLLYTPFAQWTTAMSESGAAYDSEQEAQQAPASDPIVERAAHFDISFGRLMYYTAMEGVNANLQIVSNETSETVVDINLPYYLAFGRDAYAIHNYSRQEFLDREYDYHLDFFLQDGEWKYLTLKVNVMPWVKRIQHNDLH